MQKLICTDNFFFWSWPGGAGISRPRTGNSSLSGALQKKGQIRTACNMTPRVDKATVTSYGKSFEKRRVVQLWGGKS